MPQSSSPRSHPTPSKTSSNRLISLFIYEYETAEEGLFIWPSDVPHRLKEKEEREKLESITYHTLSVKLKDKAALGKEHFISESSGVQPTISSLAPLVCSSPRLNPKM